MASFTYLLFSIVRFAVGVSCVYLIILYPYINADEKTRYVDYAFNNYSTRNIKQSTPYSAKK